MSWGQGKVSKAEAEKRMASYERQALAAGIQAELQRAAKVLKRVTWKTSKKRHHPIA